MYLDGSLVAKADGQGARTPNRLPLIVGGDVAKNGSATATLDGDLDELRISTVARGPNWIAAQHAAALDQLVTVGPDQQLP